MRRSVALRLLSGLAALSLASMARADHVPSLELAILIDGVSVGTYDEDVLGCSSTGGDTFACAGSNLQLGGQYGMTLDSWNLSLDSDPIVSGITAVTNNNAAAQQFTLLFTLPTTVAPSSLMGGSLQGGVTANTADGATITAPAGSALYTALIDSVIQQTLHADPFSYTEPNAFGSSSFASQSWGTPIPSAPGPAVNTNIQIKLDFILSGNDSASLTSNFVVIPVPEPRTAVLLAFGLGAVALRRRSH